MPGTASNTTSPPWPTADPPSGCLPEGFSARCEITAVDELPEEAAEAIEGWILVRYHVSVLGTDRALIAEQTVEKLVREDDL